MVADLPQSHDTKKILEYKNTNIEFFTINLVSEPGQIELPGQNAFRVREQACQIRSQTFDLQNRDYDQLIKMKSNLMKDKTSSL